MEKTEIGRRRDSRKRKMLIRESDQVLQFSASLSISSVSNLSCSVSLPTLSSEEVPLKNAGAF